MQDLCPLCLKNGIKKNIKLLQINLQEAAWMCEEEKCVWPFGYKDFLFSSRPVGKIWSCYWDDHKSTAKLKETALTSMQLSLSNPPAIPIQNVLTEYVTTSNLVTNYTQNINELNPTQMKTLTDDSQVSLHTESEISFSNYKEEYKIETTNNSNVINNSLQSVNEKTKSTNSKNEFIEVSNNDIKEERICNLQNSQYMNVLKEDSKITNVEETNIDISKLKKDQNSAIEDEDEKLLHTNKLRSVESKTYPICSPKLKKLINSESLIQEQYNTEVKDIKSNLNVTKVEIDGLPPITLSFEFPICTTISNTVSTNIEQNINRDIISSNSKSNNLQIKNPLLRRKVTSGKQYEKFSFSNIKKKLEINNSVDTNNKNDKTNSSNIKNKNSDKISDANENVTSSNTNSKQFTSLSHDIYNNISKQKNSVITNNFPTQENIPRNISVANTTININTVLEDFLSNDYSVSENVNDDWLDSLLTS